MQVRSGAARPRAMPARATRSRARQESFVGSERRTAAAASRYVEGRPDRRHDRRAHRSYSALTGAPSASRQFGDSGVSGNGGIAPAIGVVVVNWRGADDTIACLESLAAASPRPAGVIVVENGSGDGSLALLSAWAEGGRVSSTVIHERELDGEYRHAGGAWLTIVASEHNRGFAGGSNLGISLLEADLRLSHFLLLNNDAAVEPGYFRDLTAALSAVPDAALLSGTIYEGHDRSRLWYAGGGWLALRSLGKHRRELPTIATPTSTDFVCGCTMLISRPALARLGRLAECYFPGYMEDAEYSWRARAAGLRLVYAPHATAYHKVSASFGAEASSPTLSFTKQRHRMLFVRRNYRGWLRAAAIAYLVVTKPGRAAVEALRGNPRRGWAILSGMLSGLREQVAPHDVVAGAPRRAAIGPTAARR
jgi:GT2 family glycosyltransferase